jgi:hypothetical protein
MRLRVMNPHAQSKDPCNRIRGSTVAGDSPAVEGTKERERHEFTRATPCSCRADAPSAAFDVDLDFGLVPPSNDDDTVEESA